MKIGSKVGKIIEILSVIFLRKTQTCPFFHHGTRPTVTVLLINSRSALTIPALAAR